jgi:hypothetical protein
MKSPVSNEKLVFNFRTLRLIIGALAFAFPCTVVALTGRITTSISASYHEPQTRNVFVGFLFIIGAILVSYKGHKVIVANSQGRKLWVLAKRYQEDLVSLLGGMAAIATALFPTYCDGCSIDIKARIHATGAVILFTTVVYFCLIAFMRSVNEKLLKNPEFSNNQDLMEAIGAIRDGKAQGNPLQRLLYRLLTDACIFCRLASAAYRDYEAQQRLDASQGKPPKGKRTRLADLWNLHGKKITRGWVYLGCGSLIAAVLLAFVLVVWRLPDQIANSAFTFWIETVALWLFGLAWMTASQLQYIRKIRLFLKLRRPNTSPASQIGGLDDIPAAR